MENVSQLTVKITIEQEEDVLFVCLVSFNKDAVVWLKDVLAMTTSINVSDVLKDLLLELSTAAPYAFSLPHRLVQVDSILPTTTVFPFQSIAVQLATPEVVFAIVVCKDISCVVMSAT